MRRLISLRIVAVASAFALYACDPGASTSTGGSGGSTGSGGTTASGGSTSSGGTNASGGTTSSGGTTASGGTTSSGGTTISGGTTSGSGTTARGGTTGSGGTLASGGTTTRGGTTTTGGTTGGATSSTGGTTASTGGSGGSAGGYPENTGADCAVQAGALKKNQKLPDPFAMNDGTRISSKSQWECRRNEIKKDIEKYEIGTKPEPPTVAATLSGKNLSVKVTTSAGSITLTSAISGSGSCVVIGMNGTSSLVSGCQQAPFKHDEVIAYAGGTGSQNKSDKFYTVYPELFGKIGSYNAWSWGISRLIDGLEQVKSQLGIDTTKIAVHGCSYAGKMALFGGAFDERVALTIAQESGGGGITSWRTSQDFTTRTGTNVEKIDNTNYAWFMSSMKSLDPYSLPHDHHELVAMIAPRAVIALGNPEYEWLGDESGYRSVMAAKEVFKALGVEGNLGYDFTGSHAHCSAATTQQNSVKAYVDKFLKGTGTANVAVKPSSSKFDLDYTKVIDWTTPTLQ